MKESTREAIDSLLDLNDECSEHLKDNISAMIIYIENFSKVSKVEIETVENLSKNIKEWMSLYHHWIEVTLDSLVKSFNEG